MEEILSDIGSTPSLEPVTDDNILDLFNTAPPAHPVQQQTEEDQEQQDVAAYDSAPGAEEGAEEKTPPKIHACGFCGAVYPSHRELVEHRASHGGSRPYECHMCDKRFTQKAHLIIHRRTHTGEKPYSCHICHKRFSQSSHLNSHKRVHTGEKPFFCSICNMGFCRRQRLEAHLQQHAKDVHQNFTGLNSMPPDLLQQSLSAQNSLQQQQAALSSEAAKDFLMSIGLGSVIEETGESRADREEDSSSAPKGDSSQSHMAVFPGFSMEGEEPENRETADNDHADSDSRQSRSPTPSSISQRSPTPTSSKSRRKPAFVRKLGFGQAEKEEGKDDSATADKADDTGTSRADLSAHAAAAVRAMMCMATGSDYPNTDDLTNDLLAMDANSNSSASRPPFPAGAGAQQDRRNSPKSFPPDPPHGKSLPSNRPLLPSAAMLSSLIRTNNRVSLVDFTADDLLRHLMSRDDVYRCDFCRVIFHDAAMYHLHRSMHDKMDIRCCNLCGKLLVDKYDFTAHFLSQHK